MGHPVRALQLRLSNARDQLRGPRTACRCADLVSCISLFCGVLSLLTSKPRKHIVAPIGRLVATRTVLLDLGASAGLRIVQKLPPTRGAEGRRGSMLHHDSYPLWILGVRGKEL